MNFAEIHQVNFNPTIGNEIFKSRPALIVGSDKAYGHIKLRLVVPLRHYEEKFLKNIFFPVLKPTSENGLTKISMVDCLQLRAVSVQRFQGFIGTVSDDDIENIRAAISLALKVTL